MFLKIQIVGGHKNTGDGKGKYKDHQSDNNPAGKV
jgi:hypothetical protein